MVGVALKFDLGRYHATPWGSNVNDGAVELPPSEWRLLRALYAVSRTNVRLHARGEAIDRALHTLAQAPPPLFKLPASTIAHTRHYLPSRNYSPTRQDETDRVLDAFCALDPDAEIEVWWRATLDEDAQAGLGAAASALGYLGRSESICSAVLLDEEELDEAKIPSRFNAIPAIDAEAMRLDGEWTRSIDLLCFDEAKDPLDTMTVSVGELRRERRLQPPGAHPVNYVFRAPDVSPSGRPRTFDRPTLARFRVVGGSRPSLYETVSIATVLRGALQSLYGRQNGHGTSPVFSGRDAENPRNDQHAHAHYLATPGEDGRRIEHLTVWAREGFGPDEVAALATLSRLSHWSFDDSLRVVLTALGRIGEMAIPDLLGPSTEWRSLTPFGLPRHPKRRGGRVVETPGDQIRREWSMRHPDQADTLVEVELVQERTWQQFKRTRPGTTRLGAPHVVGAKLRFAEQVDGPIALGVLSHFGLGLFVPEET